jgi:hypothetical protein
MNCHQLLLLAHNAKSHRQQVLHLIIAANTSAADHILDHFVHCATRLQAPLLR